MECKNNSILWTAILILNLLIITIAGCGTESTNNDAQTSSMADTAASGKGAVSVSVNWPDDRCAPTTSRTKAASMDCIGISSIEIQIYGPPPTNKPLVTGWQEACDVGRGTIEGIEPTEDCTIVFFARNDEGQIAYHGMSVAVDINAGVNTPVTIEAENFIPELTAPAEPQTAVSCNWTDTGADRYELRVSENTNMTPYQVFSTQATSASPTGLSAGISYHGQVVAMDQYGNTSGGSNIADFSVLLGSPALIKPESGDVVLPGTVTIEWAGTANGLAYQIDVATDSNFNNIFLQDNTALDAASYDLTGMVVGQTYYWRVAALDGENNPGTYSQTFSFIPSEAGMSLSSPLNDNVVAKNNLRLTWNPVSGSNYRVTIYDALEPATVIAQGYPGSALFFEPNELENGRHYIWQVEALASDQVVTHISPFWRFSTLDKPQLVSPLADHTRAIGSFDFEWQNVPNAGYKIEIATDEAFTNIIETETVMPDINKHSPASLYPGQNYFWRVWPLATGASLDENYVSGPREFSTLGLPPNLTYPPNGITTVKRGFDYTWEPVTNAQGYTIYISDKNPPQSAPVYQATLESNVNKCDFDDLPETQWLQDSTQYYWQVFAHDSLENTGTGSAVFNFHTVKSHKAGMSAGFVREPFFYTEFNNYLYFTDSLTGSSTSLLWRTTDIGETDAEVITGPQNVSIVGALGQYLYFMADPDGLGIKKLCRIDESFTPNIQTIEETEGISPYSLTQVNDYIFYYTKHTTYVDDVRLIFYSIWKFNTFDSPPTASSVATYDMRLAYDETQSESEGLVLSNALGDVLLISGDKRPYKPVILTCEPPYETAYQLLNTYLASDFIPIGDRAIFSGRNEFASGYQFALWSTDGSDLNRIAILCQETERPKTEGLLRKYCEKDDVIFFFTDDTFDENSDHYLWRSDGTQGGTYRVENVTGQRITASIVKSVDLGVPIVNLNNKIYFRAKDDIYGNELRQSDGTYEGTQVVIDILPGSVGSHISDGTTLSFGNLPLLKKIQTHIYFLSAESTYGNISGEIWRTDGTMEGTEVIEAFQGPLSSFPKDLTYINGTLYFKAGDLTNGWDWWEFSP